MFNTIEEKLTFFLGENSFFNEAILLSNNPKSLAGAFRLKYNNLKDAQYPEINVLKDELLTIINDKNINVSQEKRNRYTADVKKLNNKKQLISFIWNIILAGDNEKVLKK